MSDFYFHIFRCYTSYVGMPDGRAMAGQMAGAQLKGVRLLFYDGVNADDRL